MDYKIAIYSQKAIEKKNETQLSIYLMLKVEIERKKTKSMRHVCNLIEKK